MSRLCRIVSFLPLSSRHTILPSIVQAHCTFDNARTFLYSSLRRLSGRYTARCNRADIAVRVSSYSDIEPWALHWLTHATCHSDWCQRAVYMPTLYNTRGFTPTDSVITRLHAQTMASATIFESRSTILATIQHNWQSISWRIIDSTKEFHVDR